MYAKKRLLVIAAALLLAACSVTSTNEVIKPKEQKSGLFGLSKTDDVKVDADEAFKGVNQVVIASFKVAFIDSKKEAQKAGSGFGGRSSAEIKLSGLSTPTMQQVTDAAYADFVAQLRAAGYQIADRSVLLNYPDFAKANKETSPLRQEASFFGSSNELTYVAPNDIKNLYFFMGETDKTGGFGFSNPSIVASQFADKNKIPVVSVMYTVDFAGSDGSGGSFASTSSLQVGQGISVTPNSGITFIGGAGSTFNKTNGSVKLGQGVYSSEKFGEIVMTTSDAMKAVETVTNVATALLGGGTNQSRDFEIKADPAKYQSAATGALKDTNAKLIAKMASLK